MKAKTQNITNTFEELDAQVSSESGYAPEDAEGSEETAPGRETLRASAFRHHLSTQKMYELKTKLRCSREGDPWAAEGGEGRRARAPGQGVGTSDPHCPFPQMW